EDRHVMLFDKPIELVLEVHAGVDVPALPEDIHHFTPDAHFLVTPCIARLCDDVFEDAREYVGIRHRVTHEVGQELVGVDDRQLSAFLRSSHIDALVLEVCVKAGPVWGRRHEDDALSVRETSTDEPAHSAVEKRLLLVELHNVIARARVCHQLIPGFHWRHGVHPGTSSSTRLRLLIAAAPGSRELGLYCPSLPVLPRGPGQDTPL